jgi:type III pantothenate kinase
MFKNHFNIKPLVLGKDIIVPIKNLYKKPKQVGQDRLVNAYACLKLYGKPAIIVDFGTATTFDYLDKNGTYQGGLITPGIGISLQALAENTALLPKIKLKKPKGLIGKDTVESIRSGIFYSMAAVCDGIIEKIKDKYGSKVKVVATGGLSNFFSPYCKYIDIIDKDLTLKGIHLISTKGTLSCLGWRQFPD